MFLLFGKASARAKGGKPGKVILARVLLIG